MRRFHLSPRRALKLVGRQLLWIIVLAGLGFLIWPQRQTLLESLRTLRQAELAWVGLAALATATTYVLATFMYGVLVKHPVSWRQLMLVQAATALTSRLAPIGVGTMGLTAWFLKHRQHSLPESLAVVTTNNTVGFAGHLLLLAVFLHTTNLPTRVAVHINPVIIVLVIVGLGMLSGAVLSVGRWRRRVIKALRSFGSAFEDYRHTPHRLMGALLISLVLSLVYVWALSCCAQALDVHVPFSTIFIIYTLSLATGVITPTPGGLVGVEAGIVGGFVAYGYNATTALTIALLYRLLTYWLPLIPGFFCFRAVQRMQLPDER